VRRSPARGPGQGGGARFLLGEAHAALGEREAALAALDQFVQEQPNVSQATTAKKLRIVPVPRLETQAANPVATTAAPPTVEATSLNEATLPPIAPAIETN
jgi:hypothetical protein